MSRFLSSFRRLSRKIRALETQHGDGDFPLALATYSQTGQLPQNPSVEAEVLRHKAAFKAMGALMPGIPQEPESGEGRGCPCPQETDSTEI